MDVGEFVDARTMAALRRLLPNFEFEPKLRSHSEFRDTFVSIELPAAVGADYAFTLSFGPEKQIYARLLRSDSERPHFWYRPFEDVDFADAEKLDNAFIESFERLVCNETRIIQKRGLLWHSFACEYKSENVWKREYGLSALRLGGFKVPRIPSRRHIYHSPALITRSANTRG
jgi:hypothetical protein